MNNIPRDHHRPFRLNYSLSLLFLRRRELLPVCIGRGGRTCHGLGCYCFFFLFYYFLISFLPHPVRMLCESMALASFLGTDGRALFSNKYVGNVPM